MCWGHIVTFLWALTAVIRAQVPVHAPKVVPKGVPQPPTPHWGWDIDQGVRLAPLGAHLDVQPSLAPHVVCGGLHKLPQKDLPRWQVCKTQSWSVGSTDAGNVQKIEHKLANLFASVVCAGFGGVLVRALSPQKSVVRGVLSPRTWPMAKFVEV